MCAFVIDIRISPKQRFYLKSESLERYKTCKFSVDKIAQEIINVIIYGRKMSAIFDKIKGIVMKPFVQPREVMDYVDTLVAKKDLSPDQGATVNEMLYSVADHGLLMKNLRYPEEKDPSASVIYQKLKERNSNSNVQDRISVLGEALEQTEEIIAGSEEATEGMLRYVT